MQTKFYTSLLVILIGAVGLSAQYKKVSDVERPISILPVSELKEGMRGTARTVFRGDKPEEFNVEILGVVPNWIGPKQDLIVGRLSGANAERTFVFAGMSGSPVYIDGKLVGAISYSFPFAKEPICGITPFEQMVSVVEKAPEARMASRPLKSFSYSELLASRWHPDLSSLGSERSPMLSGFSTNSRMMAVAGQTFSPIATPMTFSGISQNTLDLFADDFLRAGILPVAAAGGNTGISPLKPANENTLRGGDSIVVHLARGDIQVAAAGTVTLRDGNKIYAFGHPFFSLGSTDLPMSESHVVTVVPNANNSFKLAVPDAMVGAMTQDRSTGIYGKLGQDPKMLPVRIDLTTSRGRHEQINFESAVDPILTPLIINAGVANVLTASERGVGDSTIELTSEIKLKGEVPIKIAQRFTGSQAAPLAASAAAIPLSALLRGDFDGMDISSITIKMTAVDGSKTASLEKLSVDRSDYRAGETLELTATARTDAGRMIEQKIPITLPKDIAPGTLTLVVGDGSAIQQTAASAQFQPASVGELISIINGLKRPDRLYAVVSRTSAGAIIGSNEMPDLPPSVRATLNNDRTAGGSKTTVQTVISDIEVKPLDYIVSGSQKLTIEVVK